MSIRGKFEVGFVGRVGADGVVEAVRVLEVSLLEASDGNGAALSPQQEAGLRRAMRGGGLSIIGANGREVK